jgi:hypothetical protein
MISLDSCTSMCRKGILSALFLLATISALIAVWGLYKE